MPLMSRRRSPQSQEKLLLLSPLLREAAFCDVAQVFHILQSSPHGLTEQEAAKRLANGGMNTVSYELPPVWWRQLVKAFATPFILVLILLGIASLFSDVLLAAPTGRNWAKVLILSAMIVVSSLVRFWQEFRSQLAVERLNALVYTTATISRIASKADDARSDRKGRRRDIPLAELVPGDLLHLSPGKLIPADVRFLFCKSLFVSQSIFTGESMPVEKDATSSDETDTAVHRRRQAHLDPLEIATLGFAGTTVVSGTAIAMVVKTGRHTLFGSVTRSLGKQRTTTTFDRGVNHVSWVLIGFMLAMVPIVFVINGLLKGDWGQALPFSLAVAVGLTPEMLPLVVTASLAKGAMTMARQQVIVKRLPAMQNLGAMDLLCTDKTGTLTQDHITLVRHLDVGGQDSDDVLRLAYLNSAYQAGIQNLVDQALLEHWQQEHADQMLPRYHKLDELPFDGVRRRMSVIVQQESEPPLLICKGALEEILQVCDTIEGQGQLLPLTQVQQTRIERLVAELSQDGFRVIAVAYKRLSYLHTQYSLADEQDLVLAGYIGLLDPAKPSARDAIHALGQHGIAVKILTGDNEVVTARICQDVGLDPTRTVLGREIEGMSDEELASLAEQTTVFAKLTPLHKARVIRVLKSKGHTVGYLGDGLNDAAAFHEADVGISVDTAVDVAKEAADVILLKKSLMVLEQGVIEGRLVFGNIIKYLKMTVSSNVGNALSILVASAFLPFLPMLSLQLLVQNLLYDLSQLALPWDHVDAEFVKAPRTWDTRGLARFMVVLGPTSSLFDITTFLLLWFIFQANSPLAQSLFQSGWFVEGLLSQTLIVHVLRTQQIPFVQRTASLPVLLLTGSIILAGIVLPLTPLGTFIGLQPLPLSYFPWLFLTLLAYSMVTQLIKVCYLRHFQVWL